ncbi:unnamed protein product [Toxocara canis]|uniref:LRRCT domain-containing protein n=1 Tax=Toxocara canis TaxID=6265 RepID=A0A183U1P4_TOXCA|nr:unnamed protein product [Toxocara canis]
MSEAAVDTIERGAFQRTPQIQAIVLNKNRLSLVRADFFQGLNELYAINLGGNRLEQVEPLSFANLPALSNLDISFNQLQTLPENTFLNSFIPLPNERRVMFVCGNPWLCDSALEWFREYLRENVDIDIDKPGCTAVCVRSINGCPPEGTPLRAVDFCPTSDQALPLTGSALSLVGWIILGKRHSAFNINRLYELILIIFKKTKQSAKFSAIIMTILLISICLMALVKYGMSHRHKKQKDHEALEDEQRIVSSSGKHLFPFVFKASVGWGRPSVKVTWRGCRPAWLIHEMLYLSIFATRNSMISASTYHAAPSVITRSYAPSGMIDIDLPPAHTLDDRPMNYLY